MPPPGIPGPSPEAMATLIGVVQSELDKADQNQKPDPGRTIAHRLNRNEYSNTIRDLLGVDFRATEEFPADDSGYGFDNIGDVLTVSPYPDAEVSLRGRADRRARRRRRPASETRLREPPRPRAQGSATALSN